MRLVKGSKLQSISDAVEGGQAIFAPEEHTGVTVRAPDAPYGDVGGVPHEVRALVATLEGRTVEVPYRLLEDRHAFEILDDHLPSYDVHPSHVIQVDVPLVPDLLKHQLLVVEALGAQQGYGERYGLDLRAAPGPWPRLHRLDALDLTRCPHDRYPGVRRQVVAIEVNVPKRERLVVEAPRAFTHLLGRRSQKSLALPAFGRALARQQSAVDLACLEQRDQERADEATVLHAVYPLLDAGRVALLDPPLALDALTIRAASDLPGRLVLQAAAGAEVPAKRSAGAHLDELGKVVLADADGVGRAGRDAHAALHAAVGVDHRLLQVPEPDLAWSFFDIVHHLSDVEAGHYRPTPLSTGLRSASRSSAFRLRLAHSWKRSPSRRSSSNRSKTATRASGTSPAGFAPSTQSINAAALPREPPRPMSTPSTIASRVFAVSPRKPTSPIWGCAQEAEQPEKCILTVSWPGSPTLSSISRAHSRALTLVSTMPKRQNSLPVQATTPRSNTPGFGEYRASRGSARRSSSRSSGTPVTIKFWSVASRTPSPYSPASLPASSNCSPLILPTGTFRPT